MLRNLCRILITITLLSSYCTADYSKTQVKQLFSTVRSCVSPESDVIERVMYNRNVNKNEEDMNYLDCAARKLGWVNSEGVLQPLAMIEYFAQNWNRSQVEDAINGCVASYQGESVGEKLYNFHQCYFAKKKYD